jgi:hypothetical protein
VADTSAEAVASGVAAEAAEEVAVAEVATAGGADNMSENISTSSSLLADTTSGSLLADIQRTLALAGKRSIDEKEVALEALRCKMLADQNSALEEAAAAAKITSEDAVKLARQEAAVAEQAKAAEQLKVALAAAITEMQTAQTQEKKGKLDRQAAEIEASLKQEHALQLETLTTQLTLTKAEAATALVEQHQKAAQEKVSEVQRAVTDAVSATAAALVREHRVEMECERTKAASHLKEMQMQANVKLQMSEARAHQRQLTDGVNTACSIVGAVVRKELEVLQKRKEQHVQEESEPAQQDQQGEVPRRMLLASIPAASVGTLVTIAPCAAAAAASVAMTAAQGALAAAEAVFPLIESIERLVLQVKEGIARAQQHATSRQHEALPAESTAELASQLGAAREQLSQLSLSPQQLLDAADYDLRGLEGQLAVVLQCVRTVRKASEQWFYALHI